MEKKKLLPGPKELVRWIKTAEINNQLQRLVVDSRVLWSGGSQLQCNCKWLQIIINIFLCRGIPFFSFFLLVSLPFFFHGIWLVLFYGHMWVPFFIASFFLKNSFWLLFFNGFFNMLYIHRRTRDPAGNNGSMTMSLDWISLASSYWKSMFDLIKNQNHISFSNGIKRVVEFCPKTLALNYIDDHGHDIKIQTQNKQNKQNTNTE